MTQRYAFSALVRHALGAHLGWEPAWRNPVPRKAYDVLIVGGGPHGVATAYYLARNHGVRRMAVLAQGAIGREGVAPDAPVLCADPLLHANPAFHALALALWRGLSQELEFNVLHSTRGHLQVACGPAAFDALVRRGNLLRLHGIPAALLTRPDLQREAPALDYSEEARFPAQGALLEPAAGVARPQAVAWGYARAADRLGVDILQHCEAQDYLWSAGRVVGLRTARGEIVADKVCLALPSHSAPLLTRAGLALPMRHCAWQAALTEAVRPVFARSLGWSAGPCHVMQSLRGEFVVRALARPGPRGAAVVRGLEAAVSLQREFTSLLPFASRLRLLRQGGGVVEGTPDGSPCLGMTPIPGLYLDAAWGDGGFHATPAAGWCLAHTIANGQAHACNLDFDPRRLLEVRPTEVSMTPPCADTRAPQERDDATR